MHIWYRLHLSPPATFEDAIAKITRLREYALTCGFTGGHDWPGVGELLMGSADDEYPAVTYVTEELGKGRERHITVPAMQWVRFSTMPGDGTESALMGLATYPETYDTTKAKQKPQVWTKSTVTFEGETIPDTNPIAEPSDIVAVGAKPGWSWRDCCKTQYAHKHGRDHFLRCHLGLIRLLDYAKEIGILERVSDDGEYWETRSVDVLLKNLGKNDSLIAAIAGGFRDALGDNAGMLVAPITDAPDFEQLEAEGVPQLGGEFPKPLGDLLASRVRALAAEPYDAPLIAWPQPTPEDDWLSLEAQIDEIRRLNPGFELSILKDVNGLTYLSHPGSGLDVIRIDIPCFPDKFASALTLYNEQQSRITLTDGRRARLGIRRVERTVFGAILARPRSANVQRVHNALARAFHQAYSWEMMDKCFAGWSILPDASGEEAWEFEWSYWAAGKDAAFEAPERRKLKDRAYWAVLATGMIAVRDRYDITPSAIAVGTCIAACPPHRSERAEFPHSAPTVGR